MTEDKYEVKRCVEEAAIIVTAEKEPNPSCTITLTSPVMREANTTEGGKVIHMLLLSLLKMVQICSWENCHSSCHYLCLSPFLWYLCLGC